MNKNRVRFILFRLVKKYPTACSYGFLCAYLSRQEWTSWGSIYLIKWKTIDGRLVAGERYFIVATARVKQPDAPVIVAHTKKATRAIYAHTGYFMLCPSQGTDPLLLLEIPDDDILRGGHCGHVPALVEQHGPAPPRPDQVKLAFTSVTEILLSQTHCSISEKNSRNRYWIFILFFFESLFPRLQRAETGYLLEVGVGAVSLDKAAGLLLDSAGQRELDLGVVGLGYQGTTALAGRNSLAPDDLDGVSAGPAKN